MGRLDINVHLLPKRPQIPDAARHHDALLQITGGDFAFDSRRAVAILSMVTNEDKFELWKFGQQKTKGLQQIKLSLAPRNVTKGSDGNCRLPHLARRRFTLEARG